MVMAIMATMAQLQGHLQHLGGRRGAGHTIDSCNSIDIARNSIIEADANLYLIYLQRRFQRHHSSNTTHPDWHIGQQHPVSHPQIHHDRHLRAASTTTEAIFDSAPPADKP